MTSHSPDSTSEIEQLQAQVSALEELLLVYEQSATEQANQLEQALETLQERANQLEHAESTLQTLQSILESMGDGVVVVNRNGETLFSNPAATQILGTDPNVSLQRWIADHCFGSASAENSMPVEQFPLMRASQGESVDGAELFVRRDDAADGIWLSANARPLQEASGFVRGGVLVFRDVTRQKQTEAALVESSNRFQAQALRLQQTLQKLQQTQTHLIQAEKMSSLGQLVAGIAHEINNPVNFVYGNLVHVNQYTENLLYLIDLYQQEYPQPSNTIQSELEDMDLEFVVQDLPKLLKSMQVGADRIRQIIVSLKNFSRLDEAEHKDVNIHEGIDSTLMILQSRLKAKPEHPAIEVVREYGELPQVECYPGLLNQVFMNIFANAIDALEEQMAQVAPHKVTPLSVRKSLAGQEAIAPAQSVPMPQAITIQTIQTADNWVTIRITDNGPGMPEPVRQRLFDPFFTTKKVGKGTGLGLSISYQIIVEKHGGRLYCNSNPGTGTEFIIEIPVSLSLLAHSA